MIVQVIKCRYCQSTDLIKAGKQSGHQRVKCKSCNRTFQLAYSYEANKPGVAEKIEQMVHNGSGTRDTARVLNISPNTVTNHLKKSKFSPSGE